MIDPFTRISPEEKKLLKNLEASTYTFKKNVSVLSSIPAGDILGIVLEGKLQIIHTDYEGNRTITEELTDNAVFGSRISYLKDSESEIITKEETTIIILEYFNLRNFYKQEDPSYHQLINNLFEISINIIANRNERIAILTKKTIRNRLLEYFKITSNKTKSRNIYLPFSFTDLADYLAVDRSAMSREIKTLKDEKIIEIKARKITLLYSPLFPAIK